MSCANKRRATHGLSNHPLYRKLKNIKVRCTYPSASNYAYYGGRGIRVCDEWAGNPAAFVEWALANGYRPGLEIDRIDVDGDYEPGNCRWIPHVLNSRLRRNARCNEAKAQQVRDALSAGASLKDAARDADVPHMVAWHIVKGNTWRPDAY